VICLERDMICDVCGEEIYAGEGYYYIDGQAVCTDCASDFAGELLKPYWVGGSHD